MARKLTPLQRRFVQEFQVDMKPAQAAIRAGYSEKAAAQQAYKLMQKTEIKTAIEELLIESGKRCAIDKDKVLQELARLGHSNIMDFAAFGDDGLAHIDLSKTTREQAAAIQEITVDEYTEGRGDDAHKVKRVKLKLHPKEPALVDLGKHLNLFPKEGSPVTINVTTHEDALKDLE